jgi:hypothetical protein
MDTSTDQLSKAAGAAVIAIGTLGLAVTLFSFVVRAICAHGSGGFP